MIYDVSNDKKNTVLGKNRAEINDNVSLRLYEEYVSSRDNKGTCVFISHKSEDKEDAKAISDYLRRCGIDVYIDMDDKGLQLSTATNDDKGIVSHIQRGLKYSTHLLALISEKTVESWWVPYEIGYATKSDKSIASLILKKTDSFPDYLKIERVINTEDEFLNYVRELKKSKSRYGAIFENTDSLPDSSNLDKYLHKRNYALH